MLILIIMHVATHEGKLRNIQVNLIYIHENELEGVVSLTL